MPLVQKYARSRGDPVPTGLCYAEELEPKYFLQKQVSILRNKVSEQPSQLAVYRMAWSSTQILMKPLASYTCHPCTS